MENVTNQPMSGKGDSMSMRRASDKAPSHGHHPLVDNYLHPHNSGNFTAGAWWEVSRHAEANKLGTLVNKLGLEALSLCQPVQTSQH